MSTDAKIVSLPERGTKAILQGKDGWWGLYRERGNELVPVGITETKAEAEEWLGYKLPTLHDNEVAKHR